MVWLDISPTRCCSLCFCSDLSLPGALSSNCSGGHKFADLVSDHNSPLLCQKNMYDQICDVNNPEGIFQEKQKAFPLTNPATRYKVTGFPSWVKNLPNQEKDQKDKKPWIGLTELRILAPRGDDWNHWPFPNESS